MVDRKDRKEESYYDEEDGSFGVHQLITEAYQSGVIDRLKEEQKTEEEVTEEK